jgi:hypothetical protein
MTASTHMTTGASASPRPSSARQATTLAVTAVAFFMVVLDALVVVTALPSFTAASAGALAPDADPLIGGVVTQGLSWHWVFWVNVPVGVAAVAGARLWLAESRGPRTRLDVPGLALVSAGAVALIWALVQGSQAGWSSGDVLVVLPLGAVLVGGFLI